MYGRNNNIMIYQPAGTQSPSKYHPRTTPILYLLFDPKNRPEKILDKKIKITNKNVTENLFLDQKPKSNNKYHPKITCYINSFLALSRSFEVPYFVKIFEVSFMS